MTVKGELKYLSNIKKKIKNNNNNKTRSPLLMKLHLGRSSSCFFISEVEMISEDLIKKPHGLGSPWALVFIVIFILVLRTAVPTMVVDCEDKWMNLQSECSKPVYCLGDWQANTITTSPLRSVGKKKNIYLLIP